MGNYPGFVVGWSDWLSTAGTNAAVAIVIGEYSGVLFPLLAGKEKWIAVSVLLGFAILQPLFFGGDQRVGRAGPFEHGA